MSFHLKIEITLLLELEYKMFSVLYLYYLWVRWVIKWMMSDEKSYYFIAKEVLTLRNHSDPDIVFKYRTFPIQFPNRLEFYDSDTTKPFDPPLQFHTKCITISGNYWASSEPVRINWEKFPFLKKLCVNVKNINLDELRACPRLKVLWINEEHEIPKWMEEEHILVIRDNK